MLAITVFKKLYHHLIGYNDISRFTKINKNQKTGGILLNFQYWHHKEVPICKLCAICGRTNFNSYKDYFSNFSDIFCDFEN